MLKSEKRSLLRRLMMLVVLSACLGIASFAPVGKAAMIPCCSACDACFDHCDAVDPSPTCYNRCANLCAHGCSDCK